MRLGLVGGTRAEKNEIASLLPPSMSIIWHILTRTKPAEQDLYRKVDTLLVIPTLSTYGLMRLAENLSLKFDCPAVIFTYLDLAKSVGLLSNAPAVPVTNSDQVYVQLDACARLNLPRHLGCGILRRNVPPYRGSVLLAYKLADLEAFRGRLSLRDLRIAENEYNSKRTVAEERRASNLQESLPIVGAVDGVLLPTEEMEQFFPDPPADAEVLRTDNPPLVMERWPVLVGPVTELRALKGHIWVQSGATEEEILMTLQKYLHEVGTGTGVYTVCKPVLSAEYAVRPVLTRL